MNLRDVRKEAWYKALDPLDTDFPKYHVKPWNPSQWVNLADKLREFASEDDSLDINLFPLMWGYVPTRFKKWGKCSEYFETALYFAMETINARRTDMLTFSKEIVDRKDWLDKRPLYDSEYREYLKEKDIAKNDAIKGSVTVQVMPIPNSDIVKPLKED
jgi:hypothetical protein